MNSLYFADNFISRTTRDLLHLLGGSTISDSVDWDQPRWLKILENAIQLKLAGVLYGQVRKGIVNPIPSWVQERLRRYYLIILSDNLRRREKLKQILNITREAHIPVLIMKGLHLVEWVYEDMGLRPMVDIDLLFPLKDLGKAQKLLNENGFPSRGGTLIIDFHWNVELSGEDTIAPEDFWENAELESIDGIPTYRLCLEDLIITLCSHLALHHSFRSNGLRCLWDLKTIIEKHGGLIDWQLLLSRSVRWKLDKTVKLTLHLVQIIFNTPLPVRLGGNKVWDQLDPLLQGHLIQSLLNQQRPPILISPYFLSLFRPATLKQKLAWLRKLIWPDRTFISQKYPTVHGHANNYLYYFLRAWQKARPYLIVLLKVIRKEPQMLALMKIEERDIGIRNCLMSK